MNFFKSSKPQGSVPWKASLLFILVSVLLIAIDHFSLRFGLDGSQRIVDDLLGGLIAASIFHLYERQRVRRFSEHLHLIDLMNHYLRNALQPLMFVTSGSEGKAQMKLVEECIRRIDWALREVLPGHSQERFQVRTRGFAGTSGSTNTSRSHPKSFFGQWLDTWRKRNEKAG